jgi:predicted RNA-binding Zn-ribbon protein involved in translation (DUF1610 family)
MPDPVVWLLRGDPDRVRTRQPDRAAGTRNGHRRIRCPKCGWEPGRDDLWSCVCLHAWNTFETHGVCPGCGLEWADTQCLRCTEWSRHDDWYEDEPELPQ